MTAQCHSYSWLQSEASFKLSVPQGTCGVSPGGATGQLLVTGPEQPGQALGVVVHALALLPLLDKEVQRQK